MHMFQVLPAHHQREVKTTLNICLNFFAVWAMHFLMMSVKDQQMHHSFNVLVLNIVLHVSAFLNAETCLSTLSTNTLNE
jgi:NO-binding membrane sensor protein with MHYT domain